MINDWKKIAIRSTDSIKTALYVIEKEALRVVLVVEGARLKGVVTDGDIRRGILKGLSLESPVSEVMNANPVTAPNSLNSGDLRALMQKHELLSLPILDQHGLLVGLKTLHDTLSNEVLENPVFIMAGGFGTRLKPLTDNCPKPMLKVGGTPMLEILINNLKKHGFYKFYISTHYLPQVIKHYFSDGKKFGVEITYVHEETPLGTGGALSLLPDTIPTLPLVMINGDILTNLNFLKVLDFHNEQNNDATMCVRDYEVKVPFGVVEGDGHNISQIVEKPTYRYFINTGIYVISNSVIRSLPKNETIDMPTLFENRRAQGGRVAKFPIHEYWLDVGRHGDFKRAQIDILNLDLNQ